MIYLIYIFYIIIVSKRTIEKILEQNSTLISKVDLLLERQKILEDKVTNLEIELRGENNLITEQDFIEVQNILLCCKTLCNILKILIKLFIFSKLLGRSQKTCFLDLHVYILM